MKKIVACIVVLGAVLTACSSSSDSGSGSGSSTSSGGASACNSDPFACPAGQTCWVNGTQAAPTFECLNSGTGQIGDECQNAIGHPTCADGLTCFAVSGYPHVCTPYCDPKDPAHACPDAAQCAQITLIGSDSSYNACVPPAESGAGGAGGGSATGAGGDSVTGSGGGATGGGSNAGGAGGS